MEETLQRVLAIIESILSHLLNSDDRMKADHPAVQQCAELHAAIAPETVDSGKQRQTADDKPHMGESDKDASAKTSAAKADPGKQQSAASKDDLKK
jgi:hypothetical protein